MPRPKARSVLHYRDILQIEKLLYKPAIDIITRLLEREFKLDLLI